MTQKSPVESSKNEPCLVWRSICVRVEFRSLLVCIADLCRIADQTEKELLAVLALKEPTYAEIDVLIAKYDIHVRQSLLLRTSDIVRPVRLISSRILLQQ